MAAKLLGKTLAKVSQIEIPQTGIPIIIRPFVVKKAYVVHPKVTAFQADLKAQWLTKTCLRKELPALIGTELTHKQLDFIKERMEKSFQQTMASQKIGLKWKMRYDVDLLEGLLPSLLMQCWHLTAHSKDSFLDFQPSIKTHWCRNYNFYQSSLTPGYVLRTSKPLPTFEQDIESTVSVELPGPYHPTDLKVFRHPTVHLPNSPGCDPGHPTPYPATMLLSDFTSQSEEQMLHHGIQAMFAQLVAMAMSQGYYPGQHLDEPMTTKCVITNGRACMFMAYQLNTLSLQEDFGIKNIAWYQDLETFYDANSDPFKNGHKTFYESLPRKTKIVELNDSCIKTFVSFLTQKTQ